MGSLEPAFAEMVSRPDAAVDLACASLLFARAEYPDLDVGRYMQRLDELGGRLTRARQPDTRATVEALNLLLFEEEGFHGNSDDYYDPRNSFLNEVLDRKTGIPITLCTIYMEVARRAGLVVEGVGLPGHFIVKLRGADGDTLLDPYDGGAVLSEQDCQKRLDRAYGGRIKMTQRMLAACDRKHILARMLRNLKVVYLKANDFPRALRTVDQLLLVNPHSGEDLRDRGLVHAALDCYAYAARDLEAYLARVPQAPEADQLRRKIAQLHLKARRLN